MQHSLPSPNGQRNQDRLDRYARRMRDQVLVLGRPQSKIALDLQMDEGQLSRVLNGREALGIHHLEVWDREIGPQLLDYIIAQREDAAFAPAERLVNLFSLLERQHGVAASDLVQALEDGQVTADEVRQYLPDLMRLQFTLAEIIRQMEAIR